MWYALEHLSNKVIAKAEKYNECSDEAFRKMPWKLYSPYILTTDAPKCNCSDRPFHYDSCPLYESSNINEFEKLGMELSK